MKKTVILLTGCIRPNGMAFTQLTDTEERRQQYVEAIHYYLDHTNCQVVFCENSQTDLRPLFDNVQNRLEILTFSGNQDKKRGKGYGEVEIIEYAFRHSSFIHEECIVIKITGRLIINNIATIVNSLNYNKDFVTCLFHSDLSFADSRIICATTSFYKAFLTKKDRINDSKGVFFEHILSEMVIQSSLRFIPFVEEPQITGRSGTTGEWYKLPSQDTDHKNLYQQYALRQLLLVYKASPHRHISFCEKILITLRILKYRAF